jgi:hypothetical protein
MTTSDRFDQYSQDEPSWTLPPPAYKWIEPTRIRPSRQVAMGLGGFGAAPGGGGGGGGAVSSTQRKAMSGDEFVNRWRHSEERADRMARQYEGTQAWQASPQDYEDVLGPERSGGMEKVTSGPKTTGLLNNEGWGDGTAGVRVPAKPTNGNGNGLSGGAARPVPTEVGSFF